MGQTLSVCLGRTIIINDVKNCNNPGNYWFQRLIEWKFYFLLSISMTSLNAMSVEISNFFLSQQINPIRQSNLYLWTLTKYKGVYVYSTELGWKFVGRKVCIEAILLQLIM